MFDEMTRPNASNSALFSVHENALVNIIKPTSGFYVNWVYNNMANSEVFHQA